MDKLVIEGGSRLCGKVDISGAKNSAVAILPATLLADEKVCKISNLPNIEDIYCLKKTINYLGGDIKYINKHTVIVDSKNVHTYQAINEETKKMRASYYLLGILLTKYGQAELNFPGGCPIGARPIDLHLKAFSAMGAKTEISHGTIKVSAKDGLHGADIYFDTVSVGATINTMFAAVKATGTTYIRNAAKEPHIIDVANFLNKMGANIQGAGTDTIKVKGVEKLIGCDYSVVSDQIEAGTFMIAAVLTKGDVLVSNIIPKHLDFLTAKLEEMGVNVEKKKNAIRVFCTTRTSKTDIKTAPYPGFPTDLQQPMSVLLGVSEGSSMICESIWENRFKHLNELQKMGIKYKVEANVAVIEGVEYLSGAEVSATDLRGGAAMILAGLIAEGKTTIDEVIHIDRGYEDIENKLKNLGAKIKRISSKDKVSSI